MTTETQAQKRIGRPPKTRAVKFPYVPQKKQKYFHATTTDPKYQADEVLYGGAAGGGKSAAIVADAFKNAVKYPRLNILILRRTLPELRQSILLKQFEWYPKDVCKYRDKLNCWEFENGSRIWLGYCEYENDIYRYQSAEFDIIYIDEAAHFHEHEFRYLKSRNRTSNQEALAMGFRPQMKLTSNPGGVGHAWLKKRFISIGEPMKIHVVQEDNEEGELVYDEHGEPVMMKRIFIPAFVDDNKYVDSGYKTRLYSLSKRERDQLLYGNWDAIEGQFFDQFNRRIHVIEPFEIPSHWRRYRAMDEGYNDPFVCLWIAMDEKGNAYVYREFVKSKLLTHEQVEKVKELSGDEQYEYNVGDTSFWNKSKTTGEAPAEIFAREGVPLIQATKERVNGWKRLREWLAPYEETDPVTGEKYTTAKLKIFNTCRNLIEAIPSMIVDKNNPEDIEEHPLDHTVDALRYWCMSRPMPSKPQEKPKTEIQKHKEKLIKRKRHFIRQLV